MCGIAGSVAMGDDNVLAWMLEALHHRGPDDEGVLVDGPVALGSRRLSIIDLEGGRMPLFDESGRVAVVQNGEIYNYQALRAELERAGHRFRTRSDTEVIAHGYEAWGPRVVERLRGMFALALLDRREPGRERVLLARDRFGIKPLYLARGREGGLLFASEVRALLASGHVPRTLSEAGLASYLLFGSVQEPLTLVEGVRSLEPGHLAIVEPRTGALREERYWTTPPPGGAGPSDPSAAAPAVRALLEESVRLHLLADVPLGLFLSAGVDSTVLAALAVRAGHGETRTFTLDFPEAEFSEAGEARATADRLGTRHAEARVGGAELRAMLPQALAAMDQPTMDGVNTFVVSWAARRAGLKVALSGLGGDELFGGYASFAHTPRLARWQRLPAPLRRAAAPVAARAGGGPKAAAFLEDPGALPHPYFYTRLLFTPAHASALRLGSPPLERSWAWAARHGRLAAEAGAHAGFHAVSRLEASTYMASTLLRDTDGMSMAHSLEVRVPFLDHVLAEHVLRLPEPAHRGGRPKALLLAAARDLLPPGLAERPKRGFTFPWARWLRADLRATVAERLASPTPTLAACLETRRVTRVWQDFEEGRTSWSRPWSLFALDAWVERHLDHPA